MFHITPTALSDLSPSKGNLRIPQRSICTSLLNPGGRLRLFSRILGIGKIPRIAPDLATAEIETGLDNIVD